MIDSHDEWNPFNPINQKEVEMYSEEQLLQEQLETLQTRYDEKVRHCLHLQSQLRRLAQIEMMQRTFGTLTYEERKEQQIILSIYQII